MPNEPRWVTCDACGGVFAFIRASVELRTFMSIQSDDYEDWDELHFERHAEMRCIDCGRTLPEIRIATKHPTDTPFRWKNLRQGERPLPRASLSFTVRLDDDPSVVETIKEIIATDCYCTLDDERKLVIPVIRSARR